MHTIIDTGRRQKNISNIYLRLVTSNTPTRSENTNGSKKAKGRKEVFKESSKEEDIFTQETSIVSLTRKTAPQAVFLCLELEKW
jgi:hypothetical protein